MMNFLQKYRFIIATFIILVVGAAILYLGYQTFKPVPDNTTFKARYFSFVYPRLYDAKEYAPGVVSVGHKNGDGLNPLVEVDRYQSDPESKLPANFEAFMKIQAAAFCGADGSVESITCTQVGVTPYTSPAGLKGNKLNLTLVRKNLKTGTTTTSTYGPMYAFDITEMKPETLDDPLRYTGIFVYPSLSAFIDLATTSPALIDQIVGTLKTTAQTTP